MHPVQLTSALTFGLGLMVGASVAHASDFDEQRSLERAGLQGTSENPPVISESGGTFLIHIGDDDTEYRLEYDGASTPITMAHIHVGLPWENGPVVVFLCTNLGNGPAGTQSCPPGGGVIEGEITTGDVLEAGPIGRRDIDALRQAILEGATYVNVHSEGNPSGEIRGQISPRPR